LGKRGQEESGGGKKSKEDLFHIAGFENFKFVDSKLSGSHLMRVTLERSFVKVV
jgi:hypothetical protein